MWFLELAGSTFLGLDGSPTYAGHWRHLKLRMLTTTGIYLAFSNFLDEINSSHNCEISLCMSSVKKQIHYFFFDDFDQFSASTFP